MGADCHHARRDRLLEAQPRLSLPHRLARVEAERARAGRARIPLDLLPSQSLRILRRQVHGVGGERDVRAMRGRERQPRLREVAARAAVVAIPVELEAAASPLMQ